MLLGPCTLFLVGDRTVALASARTVERAGGRPLLVGADLEGSAVPVVRTAMARYVGACALVLAGAPWPTGSVSPLALDRVGSLRAASSASFHAVGLAPSGASLRRAPIALSLHEHVLASRGGSGDDRSVTFATADAPPAASWHVDGAAVVARYPASRALGLAVQVRLVAIACTAGADRLHTPWGVADAELVPIDAAALASA